jgi:hypothetical protein
MPCNGAWHDAARKGNAFGKDAIDRTPCWSFVDGVFFVFGKLA